MKIVARQDHRVIFFCLALLCGVRWLDACMRGERGGGLLGKNVRAKPKKVWANK